MADPKFRYLIIDEDGDVYGTAEEKVALHAVEELTVVDTETGTFLQAGFEKARQRPIQEVHEYEIPDAEDDEDD